MIAEIEQLHVLILNCQQSIINIILITLHRSCFCDLLQVREPVSLIIHHMPIAITLAFFGNGDLEVGIST